MSGKDKLIGVALILIGIAFIALGVMTMMPKSPAKNNIYTEPNTNLQVYTEQQNETSNEMENEQQEQEQLVDVYTEDDTTNTDAEEDEGSTRYIY